MKKGKRKIAVMYHEKQYHLEYEVDSNGATEINYFIPLVFPALIEVLKDTATITFSRTTKTYTNPTVDPGAVELQGRLTLAIEQVEHNLPVEDEGIIQGVTS
jgi:hypothetical protein